MLFVAVAVICGIVLFVSLCIACVLFLQGCQTRAQWAARAASCVRAINAEYNVSGLCAEFPDRLQACMDQEGDRLAK